MAKRPSSRARRDAFDIANRLPAPLAAVLLPRSMPFRDLSVYEDRREYHPDPVRPAAGFLRSRHRLMLPQVTKKPAGVGQRASIFPAPSHRITFRSPSSTIVCVRRNQRKEVLHAIGKAGKRGQRRPRQNAFSEISCRRK